MRNKILSVEMIPFANPEKMQKDLQQITDIRFNTRSGVYKGVKYVSLFNFFIGQSVDIFENELLKVTIFKNDKGIKYYELERF